MSTALSIETTDHNGVDIVSGNWGDTWEVMAEKTWGKECVWPFPWPGIVYDAEVDSPFGATKHAHCQIDTTDPATGTKYSLVYLHISSVTQSKKPEENKTIVYQQGDTIGRMGNNGFVRPAPTPEKPLNGTHLHLGLGVKLPGEQNFTMVDPLLFLDINSPFRIPFLFTKNLYIGMTDPDVTELQRRIGLSTPTGYFGWITYRAVVRYQKANGISPTGFVGTLTRASLNKQ
jgi:hypothetical protein